MFSLVDGIFLQITRLVLIWRLLEHAQRRREDVHFCSYFYFFKLCRSQVRQPADATVPTAGPVTTYFKAVQVKARVAADTSAAAGATQSSKCTYLMRDMFTTATLCNVQLPDGSCLSPFACFQPIHFSEAFWNVSELCKLWRLCPFTFTPL